METTDLVKKYTLPEPDGAVCVYLVDVAQTRHLQHQVWLLVLKGKRHHSELPAAGVKTILDVGAGTGAWALSMARSHPEAAVTATDLTPPELPQDTKPPNLTVQYQDAANDWPFPENHFDFIHGRMLGAGIQDWGAFAASCWKHLAPGGKLELSNPVQPYCADRTEANSESASAFVRFSSLLEQGWVRGGLDWASVSNMVGTLTDLGFADAHELNVRWPIGEWADNDRERRAGALTMVNFTRFAKSVGVPVLTRDGFMPQKDAEEILAAALEDVSSNHMENRYYVPIKVHTATKPAAE